MDGTLATLLRLTHEGVAECTLPQLFKVFEANSSAQGTLSKIQKVAENIRTLGLEIEPPLSTGEIDSVRIVRYPLGRSFTAEQALAEIALGESANLEFKSSLLFPTSPEHSHLVGPALTGKSKEILHSSLKTLAAFLNSSGGILYIGVQDDGNISGVECDFPLISADLQDRNIDQWQLYLRNCIVSYFKDGPSVSGYINCDLITCGQHLIARLKVSKRNALSFIKTEKGFKLYERDGNQTRDILIEQIEDFFARRSIFSL